MPSLLSGRVKVSTGTNYTVNNYITLNQTQAGLGTTPSQYTGYTLVIGPDGKSTFTNTLGSIAFNSGTITSNIPSGDLTLNPTGTGTITLNGPVNIPDGIIGSGYKKEAVAATTANVFLNATTATVIYDGIHVDWLDRIIVRANIDPTENGIYYVSTATYAGTLTDSILLSRALDATTPNKLAHATIPVISGNTYANRIFFTQFTSKNVVNADPVFWYEIVDSNSTQTVYNKLIESATIGEYYPGKAQFTFLTATNLVTFTNDLDSTATSNGALVVTGGVGIAKSLNVGGDITVDNSFTLLGQGNLSPTDASIYIQPTGVGTIVVSPATAGTINNVDIGTSIARDGTFRNLSVNVQEHIYSTLTTTSTTTGALVVDGGVGIAGDLVLGGQLIFSGNANEFRVNNLAVSGYGHFTSSTNSTSTTTGSLIVDGGVGIGQDLVLGGQLIFSGNAGRLSVSTLAATSTTNATSTDTGAITVAGGVGIAKDLVLGGQLIFSGEAGGLRASTIYVTSSTNSTSTNSGALIVTGGAGIGRDVNIGGSLNIGGQLTFGGSTTATFVAVHILSTASNVNTFDANALYVEGGTAVKKDLSVYGNAVLYGNLTVKGTQTNVESTSTYVVDPIFDIGTGANNTPLAINDGYDRGLLLHYNTAPVGTGTSATNNHAFLGRDTTTGFLTYKTNIFPGASESFTPNFTNTGSYGTALFAGLRLNGGTTSLSTNSGDLQVVGGIGIFGNSTFAGKISFTNASNSTTSVGNQALTITGGIGVSGNSLLNGITKFGSATASTSPTTGGVIISGGLGLSGALYTAGPVRIQNSTAATSTTTGALQIVGGVGIQGDLYVRNIFTENGSNLIFDGGTITQPLVETNPAQSLSTTTGAVVITGGIGIGKDAYVGGTVYANRLFSEGSLVLTTATFTGFDGGTIHYPLIIGDNNPILDTTGLTVNSVINSFSTDSGAIVTVGGVGIGQDLHVGGTIYREGDIFTSNWGNVGIAVNLASATYTDTQGSGNYTNTQAVYVGQPTFNSPLGSNYDRASTIFVEGAPKALNGNTILTDKFAVWVNDGKVHIASTATSATNYLNNAFSVAGGFGISGQLYAAQLYDSGNRAVTSVTVTAGQGLAGGGTAFGPNPSLTLNNIGVLSATAGTGVNIDKSTGTITISNIGVTEALAGTGITLSRNTGSVTVTNSGVVTVTGGTDITVSTSTGNITVTNTSTLQSVTDRGAVTSNAISITNTGTTALEVVGSAIIDTNATVNGKLTVGNNVLTQTSATIGTLTAGDTLITGNLTVAGTYTYVNSSQLTVDDPVIDIGTGPNNAPLSTNDGFDRGMLIHYNTGVTVATDAHAFLGRENSSGKLTYRTGIYPGGETWVPNPVGAYGFLGSAIFAGLELQGGVASSGSGTGDLQVAGGIYAGNTSVFAGRVNFTNSTNASSTNSAAVVYTGGVGISKNLYVGGDILINGFALSTATTYNGGRVTLPIFLDNNTASTSTNSGALIVGGGVGIAGDVNVGGTVNASQLLVNGLAPTTSIKLVLGNGLVGSVTTLTNTTIIGLTNTGILNLSSGPGIQIDNTGTFGVSTITNTGVLSVTGVGPGLYVSTSTGNISLQNTGVTNATAGTGISISTSTGSIVVTNIGVTQLNALTGITLTANTGSISIVNAGVTSLIAGTDTRVSSNTGDITIWDVSTLQTVTDRGYTTTNPVQITNATGASSTISGALQVIGGVGIGQNLWVGGYSQVIGDSSVSGAFNLTGLATLNSSANITGRLTLTGSGITDYIARVKGGGSGDQIAFGTSGSAGYGVHLDVLNSAGNGYAPFSSTASSYAFYINGTPSIQFNSSGNLVVQTATASNDYTGGAVQVAGGVGITGALNVNGKIASNSGYIGLNPWTIFTGTSNVTVVDSGVGLREVDVVVSGTNVTRFYNNSVYVPVTINSADVVSTGTITRSSNLSKGAWGATGVALSIPSATYTDTTSVGSVGSSHITAFGQPTISASNNTSYTNASTVYIGNAPAQGTNVTLANTWSLYVNSGKVKIADATASNSAQTGALQVAGGVGIGGDVNIDGVLDVNGNAFAVGNSEIVTFTSPVLTNNSTVNLDTFATSAYQSAKYFIQVVDNTAIGQPNKMYITELIVYHDGNGQIYISEYGMASNLGDLGDFDASITGGTTVQLTFKPNYTPTSMVVKVHRTTLSR